MDRLEAIHVLSFGVGSMTFVRDSVESRHADFRANRCHLLPDSVYALYYASSISVLHPISMHARLATRDSDLSVFESSPCLVAAEKPSVFRLAVAKMGLWVHTVC